MSGQKQTLPRLDTQKIKELKRTKLKMKLSQCKKNPAHYCCPDKNCAKTGLKANVMMHYCNVHLREKRFMCTLCSFSDFYLKNVQRHLETHEDTRVWFACGECEVRYVRAGDLHCKHQRRTGHKGVREIPFTVPDGMKLASRTDRLHMEGWNHAVETQFSTCGN